jgi:N-acetylmuramoyl-L-alanine amidase CwlA
MSFQQKYIVTPHYLSKPSKRRSGKLIVGGVKFIVAHDTGNPSSTAANNVAYYDRSRNEASASAHIFVDDKEILECIPALTAPPEKAWHVLYNVETDNHLYGYDANDSAIGVEYCYGGKIDADEAYRKYVWVIACLCEKFQLDPAKAVVGHFFLDPKRKTDPVTGLAQSRRTYEQLLKDIVTEYQRCNSVTTSIPKLIKPAITMTGQAGKAVTTTKLNVRKAFPQRTADILQTVPAGTSLDYQGWVVDGESVNGNSKWYQTNEGDFFWSGGVTSSPSVLAVPLLVTNVSELKTLPTEDFIKTALEITGHFEDATDPFGGVSSDFDGMGISLGVLQWNIGSGSLQPLIINAGRETVLATMPQHGKELWQSCTAPINQGLEIVRRWQHKGRLDIAVKTELKAFAHSNAFINEQIRHAQIVAQHAWNAAVNWNTQLDREAPSLHQFCWFFDLFTQNGGLKGISPNDVVNFIHHTQSDKADDLVCDWLAGQQSASHGESDARKNAALWRNSQNIISLELLIASYLRAQKSKVEWRVDVLNRKGTIAMKSGWVHGVERDFSRIM